MNWIVENKDLLIIASPILIIHLAMFMYCAYLINKEGVANLNKPLWLLIAFLFQLVGPIVFIILGRNDT